MSWGCGSGDSGNVGRDHRDFERHVDYSHWNLKYGYVSAVAHWPYSSFHHPMRRGVYSMDWAGISGGGGGEDGRWFGEPREDG